MGGFPLADGACGERFRLPPALFGGEGILCFLVIRDPYASGIVTNKNV